MRNVAVFNEGRLCLAEQITFAIIKDGKISPGRTDTRLYYQSAGSNC